MQDEVIHYELVIKQYGNKLDDSVRRPQAATTDLAHFYCCCGCSVNKVLQIKKSVLLTSAKHMAEWQ